MSQVEPFRWFTVGKPTGSVAHKTIFLVGATGSGKSTLVDAMVNYILGVKWDDPFRFKVVPDENQCGTRCITSYTIHHTEGMTILYTLTIIDTPGFGDEGTMKTICEFFVHSETKIDYINAIGFVASSVDRKLSPTQNYVISSVLSIFGKDIRDNVRLLATFTDGSFPPVVEACVAAGFPLKTDADTQQPTDLCKFDNSVMFASKEESQVATLGMVFWAMAAINFKTFFEALDRLLPKSMERPKQLIRQRMEVDALVKNNQIR